MTSEEMKRFERSIIIFSQSIAAFVEAQGMITANVDRVRKGESIAYSEKTISSLIDKYGLDWNLVVGFINGR